MLEKLENSKLEKKWNKELILINGDKKRKSLTWKYILALIEYGIRYNEAVTRKRMVEIVKEKTGFGESVIYREIKILLKNEAIVKFGKAGYLIPSLFTAIALDLMEYPVMKKLYNELYKEICSIWRERWFEIRKKQIIKAFVKRQRKQSIINIMEQQGIKCIKSIL